MMMAILSRQVLDLGIIPDVYVGASRSLLITGVVDADGEAVDLSGVTIIALVKSSPAVADDAAEAEWTATATGTSNNDIELLLSDGATSGLQAGVRYYTDVVVEDAAGERWLIARGEFVAQALVSGA